MRNTSKITFLELVPWEYRSFFNSHVATNSEYSKLLQKYFFLTHPLLKGIGFLIKYIFKWIVFLIRYIIKGIIFLIRYIIKGIVFIF